MDRSLLRIYIYIRMLHVLKKSRIINTERYQNTVIQLNAVKRFNFFVVTPHSHVMTTNDTFLPSFNFSEICICRKDEEMHIKLSKTNRRINYNSGVAFVLNRNLDCLKGTYIIKSLTEMLR